MTSLSKQIFCIQMEVAVFGQLVALFTNVRCQQYSVMDLERGIAIFLHSFKEGRTDMKVVRHYAPLKIYVEHWCYSKMMDAVMFSRAPIFESRGLVGSLFHNFRSITEYLASKYILLFQSDSEGLFGATQSASVDIEDIGGRSSSATGGKPVVTSNKRKRSDGADDDLLKSWKDILGSPPPMGTTKVILLILGGKRSQFPSLASGHSE